MSGDSAGDTRTGPAAPGTAGGPAPGSENSASSPAVPATRPPSGARRGRLGRWWWIAGLAIAALVVIVLSPLASPDPDGLERVAEDQGFLGRARNVVDGLLSGYGIPGIDDPAVSTVLSGLLGLIVVVVAIVVLGRVLARRRPEGPDSGA